MRQSINKKTEVVKIHQIDQAHMATRTPKKVKKLRQDLGLTQSDFAKPLGKHRVYFVSLEQNHGTKQPSATLSILEDCISKKSLLIYLL